MAISWKKGNKEPISHLEDLIHEVVEDTSEYFIQVNEQRLNGKINSILITVNLDERKENENNERRNSGQVRRNL